MGNKKDAKTQRRKDAKTQSPRAETEAGEYISSLHQFGKPARQLQDMQGAAHTVELQTPQLTQVIFQE
jgi:hypothetical protein